MNFDKLYFWTVGLVIAAAIAGHLEELQRSIWLAQANLIRESRASDWGSPRFFPEVCKGTRECPPARSKRRNKGAG
jgi:hypothetical protein